MYISRDIKFALLNGETHTIVLESNAQSASLDALLIRYAWHTMFLCNDFHRNNVAFFETENGVSIIEYDGMLGRMAYYNHSPYNVKKMIGNEHLIRVLHDYTTLKDPQHTTKEDQISHRVLFAGPYNYLRNLLANIMYEGKEEANGTVTFQPRGQVVEYAKEAFPFLQTASGEDCMLYLIVDTLEEEFAGIDFIQLIKNIEEF